MVDDVLMLVDIARQIIGVGALLLGSLAILLGAIGLLRLGDVYQRMHGAGIVDTGGAGLVLLGLLLLSPDWTVAVRIVLIGGLLIMTSPTATHAIARAARFSGVEPILSTDSKEKEG